MRRGPEAVFGAIMLTWRLRRTLHRFQCGNSVVTALAFNNAEPGAISKAHARNLRAIALRRGSPPMSLSANAPLSIGRVVLTVHDLAGVSTFYQHAMGLHELTADASAVQLGVGSKVLLELRKDLNARRHAQDEAGLFHTAFLLPTRGDLARWMVHAAEQNLQLQGASDHRVSEAIYLADPEGNGIEIYVDRPPSAWAWTNGLVQMTTERLNVQDLMASAGTDQWKGFPDGSIVGHVHLQVGAIPPAEAFYAKALGLDMTCHYRDAATFFSTGGYHHHLATNIWNSRGAPMRSLPSTGLADVELVAATADVLGATRSHLEQAGVAITERADGLSVRDPWGTSISVVRKPA